MPDIDKIIIEKYKSGNKDEAISILIKEYKKRLYWHIRKLVLDHEDSDDILQLTFIKAWKGLENFKENSKLYTWLYRIATNESITFLNSKKRRSMVNIDDIHSYTEEKLESDIFFTGDEIQKKLFAAISTLPEKQKAIFNLKYFEEMKYEEISEIMETTTGALKASYHHAVKKIETFLKDN
jgi:RNA polymerase sigma-70 factor (ECF subfamily)